jgi:hypothetical protein
VDQSVRRKSQQGTKSTLLTCYRGATNTGKLVQQTSNGVLNSTFIAPKWPDFKLYSALIAHVIRRLLHQSKRTLTFIAPIRTESIHRCSVNRHKLKLYHPPDSPTTFVSDCCLCNMVKVWYVGDVNPGAGRFAFVIGSV